MDIPAEAEAVSEEQKKPDLPEVIAFLCGEKPCEIEVEQAKTALRAAITALTRPAEMKHVGTAKPLLSETSCTCVTFNPIEVPVGTPLYIATGGSND